MLQISPSLAAAVISGLASSFLLALFLSVSTARYASFAMDVPGAVQTSHAGPTPRVGGLAIYMGLLFAWAFAEGELSPFLAVAVLAGAPAFAAGLAEDLTRSVRVELRLAATMLSGIIACALSGVAITHVGVPAIDMLLAVPVLAVCFTAVAVAGVANAINIIDGYNGLASGSAALSLLAIAVVAYTVGDLPLAAAAICVAAVVAGFWLVNFPWGKIFLGDGGAYFVGFILAWFAVLLPARNAAVSPWASLLICGYPVLEVLYSVARRLRCGRSPVRADSMHLHSLVAVRIIPRHLERIPPALQNSAVSALMLVCAAFPALLAVALYGHTSWLQAGAILCLLLYHSLYRYVARI